MSVKLNSVGIKFSSFTQKLGTFSHSRKLWL